MGSCSSLQEVSWQSFDPCRGSVLTAPCHTPVQPGRHRAAPGEPPPQHRALNLLVAQSLAQAAVTRGRTCAWWCAAVVCSTQITPDKEETDCRRGSAQLSAPDSRDRFAGLCCSVSPSSGGRDGLVSGSRELVLPGPQQIPPRGPGGLPAFSGLVLTVCF